VTAAADRTVNESRKPGGRYSAVSIALHWTIAALIVSQIPLGWRMSDLPYGEAKFELFQLHKSIGLTILILSLVRLAWRLTHPAPPLPDHMARWEKVFARATHVGFYLVMIATPLGGWVLVSATELNVPTLLWGVIPWPDLPGFDAMTAESRRAIYQRVEAAHGALAWFAVGLLALHVAGALKHHLLDRDTVLWRMLPIVPKPKGS
jgi:cytochrome b561